MAQNYFAVLLFMALISGIFAYLAPRMGTIDPLKYMMDKTGYVQVDELNKKSIEKLDMSTSKGMMRIHRRMEDLSREQVEYMGSIKDKQLILKNAGRQTNVIQEAQQENEKNNANAQQIKKLDMQNQNQQHLLSDMQDRNADSLKTSQDILANSREVANGSIQRTKDLIDDERQAQEDQQAMVQQRLADQQQQMQDQQDR